MKFAPITFTGAYLVNVLPQNISPKDQLFHLIGRTTGTDYILISNIHSYDLPSLYNEALQNPYGRVSSCIIKSFKQSPESWYASVNSPSQFPYFHINSDDVKRYFFTGITEFLLPIYGSLSEIMQRWTIGNLACRMKLIGCWGVEPFLAEQFNVCVKTVHRYQNMVLYQFDPLDYPIDVDRYSGGGRNKIEEHYPDIKEAIENIIHESKYGSPMGDCRLMHQSMSQRKIVAALRDKGYSVSHTSVGKLLEEMGYSKKQDKKALECGKKRTKEEQQAIDSFFDMKNNYVKRFLALGDPVISADAKKKEYIGCYYNDGKVYCPNGQFVKTLDHDFPDGKIMTPYGVYDVNHNKGFVNIGVSKDTSEFAIKSITRWLELNLDSNFPGKKNLLITCDGGGSNGSRNRIWKKGLVNLSDYFDISITVMHFPPGKSKFNPIEHRMFSEISKNWAGLPLYTINHAKAGIDSTTTTTGLSITSEVDQNEYETGKKIPDKEFKDILRRITFIGPRGLEKKAYVIKPVKE